MSCLVYFAESPESWKWEKNSIIHREKFIKLHEYGQEHPEEIQDISTQPKGPFLYPGTMV